MRIAGTNATIALGEDAKSVLELIREKEFKG